MDDIDYKETGQCDRNTMGGAHTDLRGVSGTWRSSWFHFGASSPAVLTAELRLGETGRATARLSCLGGKEKA